MRHWPVIEPLLGHQLDRGDDPRAYWRIALPPIDNATLLSLTATYMALYMGGHTLKDWVRVTRGARG